MVFEGFSAAGSQVCGGDGRGSFRHNRHFGGQHRGIHLRQERQHSAEQTKSTATHIRNGKTTIKTGFEVLEYVNGVLVQRFRQSWGRKDYGHAIVVCIEMSFLNLK